MKKQTSDESLEQAGAVAEYLTQKFTETFVTKEAMKAHSTPEQRHAVQQCTDRILSAIFSQSADKKKVTYENIIARTEIWASVLTKVEDNKLGEQVSSFLTGTFKQVADKHGTAFSEVYQKLNAPTLGKFAFEAMKK